MSTKQAPNTKTQITSTITNQSNYGTWPDSEPALYNSVPRSEFNILVASSSPLVIGSILQFSQVAIVLLFVGRLGKDELAGTSLAVLTANVTGWSVFQGLASALDTLCPQAFGAGLKKAVGLHVQRMAGLMLCVSLGVGVFWYVRWLSQIFLLKSLGESLNKKEWNKVLTKGAGFGTLRINYYV
jgi:Na+-driven multidrug efflux pump